MTAKKYHRQKLSTQWNKIGFEEVVVCDKCGTEVFYSMSHFGTFEPKTGITHTKHRCDKVLEKLKILQFEKNRCTLRYLVIQELRQEVDSFIEGTDELTILWYILKKRKSLEDAISIRELAAAFYPKQTVMDLIGDPEPTESAVNRIHWLLNVLRKAKDENGDMMNKSGLFYSKHIGRSQFRIYNIQTNAAFENIEKRLTKMRDSINETLKNTKEILDSGQDRRKLEELELDKKLHVNERLKPKLRLNKRKVNKQ